MARVPQKQFQFSRSSPRAGASRIGVSIEELIGQDAKRMAKRGPAPKLQRLVVRIQELPKTNASSSK